MNSARDAGVPIRTVERWLNDSFKAKTPGRWTQIRDTVIGTTPAGYLGWDLGRQRADACVDAGVFVEHIGVTAACAQGDLAIVELAAWRDERVERRRRAAACG